MLTSCTHRANTAAPSVSGEGVAGVAVAGVVVVVVAAAVVVVVAVRDLLRFHQVAAGFLVKCKCNSKRGKMGSP